jgi:predicted Zn-ribbon and HTH transcriptional regulator
MNGHDIEVVNDTVARCRRCGFVFRTAFILGKAPGTREECEACNPERRAVYDAEHGKQALNRKK